MARTTWSKHLSVDRRIVRLLSASTYEDFPGCMREMVSNAYDADATQVDIQIDLDSDEITISDNGNGMTPEEFRFGRPRSSYIVSTDTSSFFVENVRFEKIEGVWVPMEADYRIVSERQNSTSTIHSHHKISQIKINPNHAQLRSFVPDIENGTDVSIGRGPEYKWHNGKKFVVDGWDGRIRYVPKEWSILVGVGKPLPQLEGIKLNLSSEQTKNRAILLCFFDVNQRPSRHCIRQLAQKAAALKEKGVIVAAVQTSQVTEKTLNEWIKKRNIPFPAGSITADVEKTRFAWGVRSLPWLILTDKQHVVTAEGFTPAELDKKLSNNSEQ